MDQYMNRIRLERVIGSVVSALICATLLSQGCASTSMRAEPVYFPSPPALPRVVHLRSFNSLGEMVPPRVSWVDFLRGTPPSPRVGTPGGIAFRDGRLYLCDTTINAVHVWDLADGQAKRLGVQGEPRLDKPVDVAVDQDGTVYVADTGRAEVVAFYADGTSSRSFKPAQRESYRPVAVAVDSSKLYAADIASHQIDVFSTSDGHLLHTFGTVGRDPGQFYFPMGLAVGTRGELVVSDMMNSRVQVFDSQFNPTLSMGQPGNRYGDMGKPKRLTVGPDGTVFIADVEFAHVHLFNDRGQLLMLMGGPEIGSGGTPMPAGIAVAENLPATLADLVPAGFQADYYVFVTNSAGAKRISLYAVGTGS